MPYKDREERNKYRRAHYAANKDKRKAEVRVRKRSVLEKLKEYKSGLKCSKCEESHPATLHFHHIDPSKKEGSIAELYRRGWSWKRIAEEIEKCEVLCANCHAKLHWQEK